MPHLVHSFDDHYMHESPLPNKSTLAILFSQARRKSTKINFLGLETAGWGGGLPREGVGVEKFVSSFESLFSLGFEGGNLGCPGIFAGISRTLGGVQKVRAKKSLVLVFRSLSFAKI